MNKNKKILTLVVDLEFDDLSKSELMEFLKYNIKYYYSIKRSRTGVPLFKHVAIQYLDSRDNICKEF